MLHLSKKILVILSACVFLQACSKVDDYLLGKDNTPTPKDLKPIKAQAKMVEKWSLAVGAKQKSAALKLQPEISANVIYTADANGLVQAVDKTKGTLLWSRNLNQNLVSGPSVAKGVIAVSTDNSTVILLNQADGKQLWQAKVSGEVLAKPVIVQNKLIVKTIDGNLYAFKLSNGEKLWLSDHGAPSLILKASSSPVVVGNTVLIGYSDGKMDAVDLDSGRLIWRRSIAYASGSSDVERLVDIGADPLIQGNVAYLASYQGYVGALGLHDGQFVWRKPASVYKNMVMDKQNLYFTDNEDIVWSINKQNGQVNWKQLAFKARGLSEPVLMGDRLVVGDKTGLVHLLAIKNGEIISRTEVGSAVISAPKVVGNNLYIMSANGKLSRFSVG